MIGHQLPASCPARDLEAAIVHRLPASYPAHAPAAVIVRQLLASCPLDRPEQADHPKLADRPGQEDHQFVPPESVRQYDLL